MFMGLRLDSAHKVGVVRDLGNGGRHLHLVVNLRLMIIRNNNLESQIFLNIKVTRNGILRKVVGDMREQSRIIRRRWHKEHSQS